MIKVGFKEVGKEVQFIEIPNALNEFNRLVDGYIEEVPFYLLNHNLPDVVIALNEEGKIKNLEPNIKYFSDDLVGNLVFCKHDNKGGLCSLNETEFKEIANTIKSLSY